MLLFTHVEFFALLKEWLGVAFGIGSFLYVRYVNNNKEERAAAKKERDGMRERIETLEGVQKTGYPKLTELIDDFKAVKTRVNNDHEVRFAGIVSNQELFSKLYENKLDNASKRVDDLEKRLDRIDDKLEKIMVEVMKINRP